MKKFNGRKLLALMMTLIMLLSLMPAAFADGEAEATPAVQGGETPAEPTPAPVEPTPEPKYLAQIGDVKYETLDDAVKADATFTVLMGEKVEPRKEFIEQRAKYAVNLDY